MLTTVGEPVTVARQWRVRLWIRIAVAPGLLLLAAEQADVVGRVGRGEMPASAVREGYLALAGYVMAGWLLTFRPGVRLTAAGCVTVRNPFGSPHRTGARSSSCGRRRTGWPGDLAHRATGDRAPPGEPRWFYAAEAISRAGRAAASQDCDRPAPTRTASPPSEPGRWRRRPAGSHRANRAGRRSRTRAPALVTATAGRAGDRPRSAVMPHPSMWTMPSAVQRASTPGRGRHAEQVAIRRPAGLWRRRRRR